MGFTKPKPPCKGCEDRHTRCHTECPDYIEWNRTRQEIEAKCRRAYEADNEAKDYTLTEVAKNKRKYHR